MNISNIAKQFAKHGGKKSAQSRFAGKSKEEISEIMRKVRMSSEQKKKVDVMVQGMVDNLNQNVRDELPHSKSPQKP